MYSYVLTLNRDSETGEISLTKDETHQYSSRTLNRMLSGARQFAKIIEGDTLYIVIVPPYEQDENGISLTLSKTKIRKKFIRDIVSKVHSGAIKFKSVELQGIASLSKRGRR